LTATPFADYKFIHWFEGNNILSTNNPYTFSVNTSRNILARFDRPPKFDTRMPSQTVQVHNVPVKFSFLYKGSDPDNDALIFSLLNDGKPEGSDITIQGLFNWAPQTNQTGKQYKVKVVLSDGFLSVTDTTTLTASNSITSIEELTKPKNYFLFQNFPNPFNPTSKIQFSIPKEEFVRLSVFNSIGQEVKVLVNQNLPTATYSVDFNGSGLTNGIYFYKLQAGGFTQTKKMILLK